MNPSADPSSDTLLKAEQALSRHAFDTCIQLCNEVLSRDAINLPAHLFRGVACGQIGQLERAVRDLGYVLERQPENVRAAFFLGQSLRHSQHYEEALERFRPLRDNPEVRSQALFESAICSERLGRSQRAVELYRELIAEDPHNAHAAANLAMLLERTNRLDEALNWAERAVLLAPGNAQALLTRARVLRRQGNNAAAVRHFEALLAREISPAVKVIALNQLARSLESLERYDDAFDRYREANDFQAANDPESQVDDYGSYGIEWARFLRQWLREHPPADWSPTPADERDAPVFLVGFPRSGTTLLDQALAAHPRIGVIEERELLLEVRRQWISEAFFDRLHSLEEDRIREWRKLYRGARAAAFNDPDAAVIVDKLPLNSIYLQLVYRLFPEAKIVLALRDPRDVCLSCYFQSFQLVGAMPYFLDLEGTARYYDLVMSLMSEALEALPLAVHTVRYEALVADFEPQMRALVKFLGQTWDERVLDYRQAVTEREISTPSYQQVSEPLHARSVARWRHYERQLEPILPTLKPWLERFEYMEP